MGCCIDTESPSKLAYNRPLPSVRADSPISPCDSGDDSPRICDGTMKLVRNVTPEPNSSYTKFEPLLIDSKSNLLGSISPEKRIGKDPWDENEPELVVVPKIEAKGINPSESSLSPKMSARDNKVAHKLFTNEVMPISH